MSAKSRISAAYREPKLESGATSGESDESDPPKIEFLNLTRSPRSSEWPKVNASRAEDPVGNPTENLAENLIEYPTENPTENPAENPAKNPKHRLNAGSLRASDFESIFGWRTGRKAGIILHSMLIILGRFVCPGSWTRRAGKETGNAENSAKRN